MTTCADLIEHTTTELLGAQTEELNVLKTSITASDTTVSLTYDTRGIDRGQIISIGLEDMYVWTFQAGSTPSATVQRGVRGTTAATHAANDLIKIAPRFSPAQVLRAINFDLRALSSPMNGLFRVKTTDLTSSQTLGAYDLSEVSNLIEVLTVQYDNTGPGQEWPYVTSWETRTNQNETDFSSGRALRIYDSIPTARQVRIQYTTPFTELSSLTQDVANVSGLPQTAHDIPPLGAAARLMGTSEARRAFLDGQPDTRRASEVGSGSATRSASTLLQLRSQRIREERARFDKLYPERKPQWV